MSASPLTSGSPATLGIQQLLQSSLSRIAAPIRLLEEQAGGVEEVPSFFEEHKGLIKFLIIGMSIQAVIGLIAIEYAFKRVRRMIKVDEDRDSKFPAFRRLDAKKWSRWKFYPGALLTMPSRLILLILSGIVLALISVLLTLGHDFKKGPTKGCRKASVGFFYTTMAWIFCFICGLFTRKEKVDFDYSYYLGKDYKEGYRDVKKTSTIICNHVSWIDTMNLYQYFSMAFTLDVGFKKAPLMNKLGDLVDSIYLPRGGNEESRAKALQQILDR
mmetsp:Transcript_11024/g.18428  ORF Transcript_11024/g.18428 Transcript_11024/m.18428 type:complete len:272 (+) Transcript_11024:24-839(+)